MAIIDCGVQVPGPLVVPTRFGLFSVANIVTPDDPHWQSAGVTWDDYLCTNVNSTIEVCPPEETPVKIEDRSADFCCADPFIVYGSYDCPPVGRPADAAFEIATRRLLALEEREVERVFWTGVDSTSTGVTGINPSLENGNGSCEIIPADLTPVSGAVTPTAAVATLESALSNCIPGVGVIHANYGLAAFLANAMLLQQDERGYHTPTGQRLALGSGYSGVFGPAGDPAPDGETWMFATGPVTVWRSDIFLTPPRLSEAVNRSLNNVRVYAERVYAVGFSCCLLAIRVNLTDCC